MFSGFGAMASGLGAGMAQARAQYANVSNHHMLANMGNQMDARSYQEYSAACDLSHKMLRPGVTTFVERRNGKWRCIYEGTSHIPKHTRQEAS